MAPREGNRAADALNEDIQTRNIRKVAVNARITAVLWGLEFIANFCYVLIWIFLIGTTSTVGLTNAILWYYVLLPYTHLMNTPYNKDRVIDDGWKSVILNSVTSIFRCIPKRQNPADEQHHAEGEGKQSRPEDESSNPKTSQINSNQKSAPIISEPAVSVISLEDQSNEVEEKPCTSDGRQAAHDVDTIRNTLGNQSSTDSEDGFYKQTTHKSRRLRIAESILSRMWDNRNDEEAYSHYFRQLLDLEDPANKNVMSHYNTFQIVSYNESIDQNTSPTTKRSVLNENINGFSTKPIKSLKNSRFEEIPLNINFVIDLMERTKQRQSRLEGFLMYCDDENSYESFISKLISFEEGLILE